LHFIDLQSSSQQALATILFIHGAGGTTDDWRRQHALSDKYRLLICDLPGHGRSAGTGETTIARYADAVIDFIKSNRLPRVFVCGHSMGGAVAQEIALREPGFLEGLILVSTGAKLRVLPALFNLIREDFASAVRGMAAFEFGPAAPGVLIEEERQSLAGNAPDLLLKDFMACDSFDIIDKVGLIRLPVLIICGREDRLTSAKYSALLHEKIWGSQLTILDECGHMPMLEQDRRFNERISQFIESLKVRRGKP